MATACVTPGTVAAGISEIDNPTGPQRLDVEHPTGFFTVELDVQPDGDGIKVNRSALLRTARKLMRGEVYIPGSVWDGKAEGKSRP